MGQTPSPLFFGHPGITKTPGHTVPFTGPTAYTALAAFTTYTCYTHREIAICDLILLASCMAMDTFEQKV